MPKKRKSLNMILKLKEEQGNSRNNTRKFLAVLILTLMILSNGCGSPTTTVVNSCPPFPDPTSRVADELEECCMYTKDEAARLKRKRGDKCPSVWEWMNRLYVLKDQLEENKKMLSNQNLEN